MEYPFFFPSTRRVTNTSPRIIIEAVSTGFPCMVKYVPCSMRVKRNDLPICLHTDTGKERKTSISSTTKCRSSSRRLLRSFTHRR